MSPAVIEHTVHDFIKLVYICEDTTCKVLGDLPALPWCFKCIDELSVKGSTVCWSEVIRLNCNKTLRICGVSVEGSIRSVMFIVEGVPMNEKPEEVFNEVKSKISYLCSNEPATEPNFSRGV